MTKTYLARMLNEACKAKGHPISGTLPERMYLAFDVRVSRKKAWIWLAKEWARRKGIEPNKPVTSKPKKSPRPIKSSTIFYASAAWRAVRFEALKKSDGCCDLCGRSKRDHGVVLHVDHIKPRSKFPHLELTATNLQVLCEECNMGKSNRDDTDWRVGQNVVWLDKIDWRSY